MARFWLVLAVATLWVLGCRTREADAAELGTSPDRIRVAPILPTPTEPDHVSLFVRGLSSARRQRGHGRIWQRLWLRPGALPGPHTDVKIIFHRNPKPEILLERYSPR